MLKWPLLVRIVSIASILEDDYIESRLFILLMFDPISLPNRPASHQRSFRMIASIEPILRRLKRWKRSGYCIEIRLIAMS